MKVMVVAGLLTVMGTSVLRAADFDTPRWVSGSLPAIPLTAIGWTEARLEVAVDANGAVSRVTGLRATPGALPAIAADVAGWRFQGAKDAGRPVPAAVLVVTMIRPPQLYDNVAPGSPAVDLAGPSDAIPAALNEARPKYPPNALSDGLVFVEVLVGVDGRVERATPIRADSAFQSAALEAALGWTFRPARHSGAPVPAYAYLIFGFRSPVAAVPPAPGE